MRYLLIITALLLIVLSSCSTQKVTIQDVIVTDSATLVITEAFKDKSGEIHLSELHKKDLKDSTNYKVGMKIRSRY